MMASDLIPNGDWPEPLSFSASLRLRLTELSLRLYHRTFEVGHLEALNMLTALQKLEIGNVQPGTRPSWCVHHCNLAEKRLDLKLPHLVSLGMYAVKHSTIVLSCPKLAEAIFRLTAFLEIQVKDAVLDRLEFSSCKDIQFVILSPEEQLRNLRSLHVLKCGVIGGSIFDDVSHMSYLETLVYLDFPATSMPSTFPQGLQTLQLAPFVWTDNVPRGVEELHELKLFNFVPFVYKVTQPWYKTQPAADMSSIDSLKDLRLGHCRYIRTGNGPLEPVRSGELTKFFHRNSASWHTLTRVRFVIYNLAYTWMAHMIDVQQGPDTQKDRPSHQV